MLTMGNLRLVSELPAGAAEMLRRVAAMCDELSALGAQVSVSVEMVAKEGEECSTSKSISIPMSVSMALPAPAAHGTPNGAGHMHPPQDGDLSTAAQGNGGSASPATTNGSGGSMAAAVAIGATAAREALTETDSRAEAPSEPFELLMGQEAEQAKARLAVLRSQNAQGKTGQGAVRQMSTEELTALVLDEIRRTATDGVALPFAQFTARSNVPVHGLVARRGCTWLDLVAEAGCTPAPRVAKKNGGGVADTNGASFRPAAGA